MAEVVRRAVTDLQRAADGGTRIRRLVIARR
jgi:hypothetical protein